MRTDLWLVSGLACLAVPLLAAPGIGADAAALAKVKAGAVCRDCDLAGAELAYRKISGITLAGANLSGAKLTATIAAGADLRKADLRGADLFAVILTDAKLQEADLSGASMVGSWLHKADLTGAALAGTDLSGVMATTAKGLTQAQLDQACGDARSRLPTGLTVGPCKPPRTPDLRPALRP